MARKNVGKGFFASPGKHHKTRSGSGNKEAEQRERKTIIKIYQMKTLEELLQELGCEGSAFDSTGEFTKAGEKAYERLEHLLYDIESLTGKKVTPIIEELDRICNENY